MTINRKDQQLIDILRKNARLPISELARRLGVSRTAAQARLQRLEQSGIIKGYQLDLSEEYLASCIKAIVMIKAPPLKRAAIESALSSFPELVTLYSISGSFDIAAVVMAPTIHELDRVIDKIGVLKGVEDTQSSVVLSTRFER